MSIAETAGFWQYYEPYDPSPRRQSSNSVCGVISGMAATLAGGMLSTAVITNLTSMVWEDALYLVPVITGIASCVLLASTYGALSSNETSKKAVFTLSGILSCVPAAPFLVGALPGLALIGISGFNAYRETNAGNGDVV